MEPMPSPFAYTQTLAKRFYKHKAHKQHEVIFPILNKLLRSITQCYTIQAELTQQCNVHYHGIVTFRNHEAKLLFLDSVRELGFSCLKPITNIEKWNEYISKDTQITLKHFGKDRNVIPPLSHIRREWNRQNEENKLLKFPQVPTPPEIKINQLDAGPLFHNDHWTNQLTICDYCNDMAVSEIKDEIRTQEFIVPKRAQSASLQQIETPHL